MGKTLEISLENMADSYDKIRNCSLLDFNEDIIEHLKLICNELGRVKEQNGVSSDGKYYVIAITKPLMFLWGQTLAFDSYVRDFIPFSGVSKDNRWDFETFRIAVKSSSNFLKQNPAIRELADEISNEKYGRDFIVPYGRFLDMYYWIAGTPYQRVIDTQTKFYYKEENH